MLELRKTGYAADRDAPVCLVSCVKDEAHLIGPFFDHYRRAGIRDFVVVDNGSSDGTREWLAAQDDCTLYSCVDDFAAARGGMDWVETLLHRYATGRWGLYADCDEHLVFPHMDRLDIGSFVLGLSRKGFDSCRAVMVDMYSGEELGAGEARDLRLQDRYDRFDADYVVRRVPPRPWARDRQTPLQVFGGPRLRLLSSLVRETRGGWVRPMLLGQVDRVLRWAPEASLPLLFRLWPPCLPALHKQPLNRITEGFSYPTAHDASNERVAPTLMALLHYKFVAEAERCLRADGPLQTQYHRRGMEREQLRLAVQRHRDRPLTYMGTRRFHSWYDLAAEGLVGERWAEAVQGGKVRPAPRPRVDRLTARGTA